MSCLLRGIFGKRPEVGETFVWDDGDPWEGHRIRVVDTRGSWVRYRFVWDDGKESESRSIKAWELGWLYKRV